MTSARKVCIAVGLGLAAVLVGVLSTRRGYEFPALRDAERPDFDYTLNKRTYKDFALRFRLQRRNEGEPFEARVVFARVDDDNYDFLHLADDGLWLGRAEAGLERRTGSAPRDYDVAQELVLRRCRGKVTVFVGGMFVAEARSEHGSAEGRLGFGIRDDSVSFAHFRPQRLERIHFADDFMSAEQDAASWTRLSGDWRIDTVRNPLRSVNAFRFVGAAGEAPAVVTAGHAFWHDYRLSVACQPSGNGSVGIMVYRREDRHYLLQWSAGERGKKQLLRVDHGAATVLCEQSGGYTSGQWYELAVEVADRRIRGFIDGQLVSSAADPGLCSGDVGLYVSGEQACCFDDVSVTSITHFRDDFSTPLLADWSQVGGSWQNAGGMCGAADGPGKLVTGESTWQNYEVSTDVALRANSVAGLCFCYQDESNHYLLQVSHGPGLRVALVKAAGDAVSIVAEKVLTACVSAPGTVALRAVVEGNVIRTYANGEELLEQWDPSRPGGRVGLFLQNGEAAFSGFAARFIEPFDRSIVSAHKTFSGEKSMANWASAEGEWLAKQAEVDGETLTTFWHRADVPGDGGISARLPRDFLTLARPARVSLFFSTGATSPNQGYTAVVSLGDESSALRTELRRDGQVVDHKDLQPAASPRTVCLQRLGRFVSISVDAHPVLVHRAGTPAEGVRAGWRTEGVELQQENVSVFSRNVLLDDFRKAPADWRIAAGLWDVTVRWECDPRWSFFSGRGGMFAGADEKLAAIWHKRSFPADFTVEFTVGQKMAREFGAYADYTRDFNVTVCADGRDLSSGYTCTFGGWHDTRTAILRQTEVVAETDAHLIPRSNSMHRQWFNIKVRRRAGLLSYVIDDETVLEYADPQPLTGGRIALWTYDNGFMISRFRVSAERTGPRELPNYARLASCRSFYDPVD